MPLAHSALDPRLKFVLLATDLSTASVKALDHAAIIERHYRAKLYIVHVVSPVPYLMAGPEAFELGCEGAARDLQQLRCELLQKGSLNGLDHEFVIRCGHVWEELQAVICQAQIDLVVVGTRLENE